MPLKNITIDVRGDVVVLDPTGTLCLCEDGLRLPVAEFLERGFLKFLLDLHRVQYIDNASLGGIVRAYEMVDRRGGKLKICNVVQRIRDLFQVTRLISLFEIFATEDEALRSFEGIIPARAGPPATNGTEPSRPE